MPQSIIKILVHIVFSTKDRRPLISYEGYGCAGGLVTTLQGERVPIPGTENFARRTQKSYADILGRMFKAETYEWNGSTVYSTVVSSFDGRDQVTRSRHYSGNTASGTYQDTTATFDGHGRLYQSHRPEQRDSSNNLKYTTYTYNPDDSILSVEDGRGAVKNFAYNSRGLTTAITWDVPYGSGIHDPANVAFSYDNLGNRTSMTDGLGTVDYTYNSLSQLLSEVAFILSLMKAEFRPHTLSGERI
jgi:YD repeat-containing protein